MERTDLILVNDFCVYHQVSYTFITGLQEAGLVDVITIEGESFLPADRIRDVEKLVRFHVDMDINMEGIEAISNLLRQIEEMQQNLHNLQQKLLLYEAGDEAATDDTNTY